MILIIDNYDSFVFNLARYVAELGYAYEVHRNDQISVQDIQALQPSHIIISPGPCTPLEAGICLELIKTLKAEVPILGICLGHQALAYAYGGRVVRAQQPVHGKSHEIWHSGKGIFENLPNPLTVGRYHSLIVDYPLPPRWKVTAKTANEEIMAIEHDEYPLVGLQFHPESILTEKGHVLLEAFISSTTISYVSQEI